MKIIGLDAASQRTKFGYAIGDLQAGVVHIQAAGLLSEPGALDNIVRELLACDRALVAIDAPLGWPRAFGPALNQHVAGGRISVEKSAFFKRLTDQRIAARLRQHPLEVAADKIARASHTALDVLDELRRRTHLDLDLVWDRPFVGVGVIEVYPAATLRAHGLRCSGYKAVEDADHRREIARALESRVNNLHEFVERQADVFDAALCLVAAQDFLLGTCAAPTAEERDIARVEGWIWANERHSTPPSSISLRHRP